MKMMILFMFVLLLFSVMPVQAQEIDPVNALKDSIQSGLNYVMQNVKLLSLPTYSPVTVRCGDGAACTQPGENWVVSMNTLQNAQTIDLILPSGTKSISGDAEVTTQGTVTIEVREKPAVETVPVYQSNMKYVMRTGALWLQEEFQVPAFERSGASSVISTNYDIQLLAPLGNSQVVSKSYDYRSPQSVTLRDGAGNTATITPEHLVSGGYIVNIASVIFADNGYGSYQMYDKVDFLKFLEQVNYDVRMTLTPWAPPHTWVEFLAAMKTKGLRVWEDVPVTKSGTNNMILTYPAGSVGTKLQAIIPKAMALSLTVVQHSGLPVIDSVDLSPDQISVGQGYQTLVVKVANKGSQDTISVSLPNINGMTVTNVVNSLVLSQNSQGTFIFYLTPTLSSSNPCLSVRILVTAVGSGKTAEKTICSNIKVLDPGTKMQDIIITAYKPDRVTILSGANVYINGQQVEMGKRITKPYGTYTVSTNNNSNPGFYAPSPVEITLSGGEPKRVDFYFTETPQGEDMTWIFWVAVIFVIVLVLYYTGLYRSILGFVTAIIGTPMGVMAFLYIVLFVAIVLILWGLYNSIMNFRLW